MSDANWFYVFDSTNSLWLQDDEKSWGPYRGAAEFADFELAEGIAARELKNKGPSYDGVVIVLADHGQPEVSESAAA